MEPQTKLQYSVTFDEREYAFSTDSTEAIASDDEKSPTFQKTNLSSSVLGGEGGDANSDSSISTSILDDADEIKVLKRKINELEARNKLLEYEIEKVNLCLIHERNKNSKLEKKLQFVKDNQDVFIKLKEAYINMKYNEAAGRKMIEIREKGQQTWDGILCKACIDSEQMRRQLAALQETYKGAYIVRPFQLEQLLNTVKCLKDTIDKREQTWSFNAERDEKLRIQIETLESENSTLRDILKTRQINPPDDTLVYDTTQNSEMSMLKKIIVKYEKRIREFENNNNGALKMSNSFNDKERRQITHLMAKYLTRKRGRSLEGRLYKENDNKSEINNNSLVML